MNRVHLAVFQGFFIGSIIIFLTGSFIATPQGIQAAAVMTFPAIPSSVREPQFEDEQNIAFDNPQFSEKNCAISPSYPSTIQQWCKSISNHADNNGIDPNLVAAIILVESAGHPQAYSTSGAVGLMQIMPRDGLAAGFMCPAGPCFSNRPATQELLAPDFNISYGANMISSLVQRFGNQRDALQAYGPGDVGYYYADLVLQTYQNYSN
jgi:soluble lytic murein transglycosylase-like protein